MPISYFDMEALRSYRVTIASSDNTFHIGDIIWKSLDGVVNVVQEKGCIGPEDGDERTFDFICEPAEDWEVIALPGEELCRKKPIIG